VNKDVEILVVFGKKPRASRSSKRYEYRGDKYFLYSSKTHTYGNVMIFSDVAPYPLIAVVVITRDETIEKAYDWIKEHSLDIKALLGDYRHRVQIPIDSWFLILRNVKKLNREYGIYPSDSHVPYTKLVCMYIDEKYVYVKVDEHAPTKRSGLNNLVIDEDAVKLEYLRRVENGRF